MTTNTDLKSTLKTSLICFIITLIFSIHTTENSPKYDLKNYPKQNKTYKTFKHKKIGRLKLDKQNWPTIHIWSPYVDHLQKNPASNFWLCAPNNHCKITYGENTIENVKNADAVIYSPDKTKANYQLPNPKIEKDREFINKVRSKDQLWIFSQMESPEYHRSDYSIYDNFFNATLSYRKDSTFWSPYGSVISTRLIQFYENKKLNNKWTIPSEYLTQDILDDYFDSEEYAIFDSNKVFSQNFDKKDLKFKQGVLSIVSNCNSVYRTNYIKKLDNLLFFENGTKALKVFGKCGNHDLDESSFSNPKSFRSIPEISKDYRFFLSFENSKCLDYITEKVFNNAIFAGIVPIVAGPKRQDYEKILPKNSFIHVEDFESLEKLAVKVNFLLSNEGVEEYLTYFDWIDEIGFGKYSLKTLEDHRNQGWCGLCKVLNDNGTKNYPVIENIQKWWYGTDQVGEVDRQNVCRL